jgi:hypothetical protein
VGTSPFARTAAGAVAGLLVLGTLAAAGCGGGGSSSSTSTAAGSTTSTAAGTTTSTGSGINPHNVPKSTPIASSDYFNILVQGFEKGGLSSSQAESAAHCIQDGLSKAGIKTQGDAEGPNTKKALQVILPCVQKAKGQ